MTTHYIHRPTPPGGETDARFREATHKLLNGSPIDTWDEAEETWCTDCTLYGFWLPVGTIWRIPGSDAPSAEMIELAKGVR